MLTREELKQAIDSGRLRGVIMPLGSFEQHQDHLPLLHDTLSIRHIAEQVALEFYPSVMVTPTVWASDSEHHMKVGGAITIRRNILIEYLYDIAHSLKRLGIGRVMILNGHGGNKQDRLEGFEPERMKQLIKDCGLEYVSYWLTLPSSFYEGHLELDRSGGHAGEFETSFARVVFPEDIREDVITYDRAKLATVEKGRAIVKAVMDSVSAEVRTWLDEEGS
jgi:creatinine amidohydrolase